MDRKMHNMAVDSVMEEVDKFYNQNVGTQLGDILALTIDLLEGATPKNAVKLYIELKE